MNKQHGTTSALTAVIIRDDYQHKGIGTELFRRQLDIARTEGLKHVLCNMLADDTVMQTICKRVGFRITTAKEISSRRRLTCKPIQRETGKASGRIGCLFLLAPKRGWVPHICRSWQM